EARLAGTRASMQREELIEASGDRVGGGRTRRCRSGHLALEPPHLTGQLVTVLAGEAREVGFPRWWQHEHRTSLLDGDLRLQSNRGGEPRKRGHGRRRARHGMEVPDRPRGRARLYQRRPRLLFTAGHRDQVERVGDLDAAEDPKDAGVGLVERQERDESVGIAHAPDLDTVIGGEGLRPPALPDPGEEWGAQLRSGVERAPRGLADPREAG